MSKNQTKSIAIIGSGFLGLTLALRFVEAGNRVAVFRKINADINSRVKCVCDGKYRISKSHM